MTCPTQNSGASTSRAMCRVARGARAAACRIRVRQRPAFEVSVRAPLRIDKPWADGCKIVVRCERNVASARSVSTLAFNGDLMMKRLVMERFGRDGKSLASRGHEGDRQSPAGIRLLEKREIGGCERQASGAARRRRTAACRILKARQPDAGPPIARRLDSCPEANP